MPPQHLPIMLPVKLRVRTLWLRLGDTIIHIFFVRGLCSNWSDRWAFGKQGEKNPSGTPHNEFLVPESKKMFLLRHPHLFSFCLGNLNPG